MSERLIAGIGGNAKPFKVAIDANWYDIVHYNQTGEIRSFDLVTGDSPNKSKRRFDRDGYIITGIQAENKCNLCDVVIPKRARYCIKCRQKKRREAWRKARSKAKQRG